MRRATILMAALAVLGTAGPSAPASAALLQQTPPAATQPATTAPADLADPVHLARLLHDPASSPDQRELAAARLLAHAAPESISELVRGLRPSTPVAVQRAAASAIAGATQPGPADLVEPIFALLEAEGPLNVKLEAGTALASFRSNPAIAPRLTELAIGRSSLPTRQGAVAGLGRLPSRSSAEALMLLLDGDAPEPLERDAAEALRAMTGLEIAADDLAGWQAWWESVSALDETAFKARLLDSRAADAVANARRADAATAALLTISRQRYRALSPADQPAMLVEYLRSPVPEMREVAALLVGEDAGFGSDISPELMQLVRAAITDPSGRVRTTAALIVELRNDVAAVEPLLAQVGREPVMAARQAQISALGKLRDPRALPTLLGLLTDPSPGVRSAAADAAADLAMASGPAAVAQASTAIRQAFLAADPSRRNGQRLRLELISALAGLNHPDLAIFYRDLMARQGAGAPPVSPEIRAAALRGMGTLGNDDLSDTISGYLSDADPKVREEAVRALPKTSRGFERADQLYRLLSERDESSEAVRRAAWESLQLLFPRADVAILDNWEEKFRRDGRPDRRLAVLRVIAEKEERAQNFEALAWRRHEMAEVHMEERRFGEAAELYRAALEYSIEQLVSEDTIQNRAGNALLAYLRARRFEDGLGLARQMIERDASFIQQVGAILKQEVRTLLDAGQPEAARTLITAALRATPPILDPLHQRQLEEQLSKLPASAPANGG